MSIFIWKRAVFVNAFLVITNLKFQTERDINGTLIEKKISSSQDRHLGELGRQVGRQK
jgi:hypothetical protein